MKTFLEIVSGILQHIQKENERLKKKWNITDKDIEKMKSEMSKYHKVDVKFLDFGGIFEPGFNDIVDVNFHIMDPKHKHFKSTRSYRWSPKNQRGVNKEKKKRKIN